MTCKSQCFIVLNMRYERIFYGVLLCIMLATAGNAEIFSAQCENHPQKSDSAGDWDYNPNTETWNQQGEIPGEEDEIWIDGGYHVRIFDDSHSVSKLEMRSNGSGANLEISGGRLEVSGIAKFEGPANSIVVSGGSLKIYWAYGGIDGLRISAGSVEVEGENWDTIVGVSQSGGEVILPSLDIEGPGGYSFEAGSKGTLKVETNSEPEEFFADDIDDTIVKSASDSWSYGRESIGGTSYATLSVE